MNWRLRTLCAALVAASVVAAVGCRKTTTQPAPEVQTFSVSHWTDRTELFMEHQRLVANKTMRFAVHLTTLVDFKPLNEGRPTIELKGADGGVTTLPGSARCCSAATLTGSASRRSGTCGSGTAPAGLSSGQCPLPPRGILTR